MNSPSSSKIRVLIADDHALVREGLRKVLGLDPGIEIADEAASAAEVLERLKFGDVGLLLLDLLMPGSSGVDLIGRVRAAHRDVPVLVLTMHADPHLARRALEAGALGYLTKDCSSELLMDAIHRVAAGHGYVDPSLSALLIRPDLAVAAEPIEQLSARERQVLLALVQGKGVSDIASDLHLATNTVSTYKARLMEKLGQGSMSELVRFAVRHGLVA
jgi:DNA-binding NarL/FixJ family response regulator